MNKTPTVSEAKALFADRETGLHRALSIMLLAGTGAQATRARDYYQLCLTEYTDAARIWGAIEGAQATQSVYETELVQYEPTPAQEEMH